MPEMVDDTNFIGMKPEKLYKMKKYSFETISGNPIVCKDSVKVPLKNLKIFGKNVQGDNNICSRNRYGSVL